MARILRRLAALACCFAAGATHAASPGCPDHGVVHLAVIPGEDTQQLLPIYARIGELIAARLAMTRYVVDAVAVADVVATCPAAIRGLRRNGPRPRGF